MTSSEITGRIKKLAISKNAYRFHSHLAQDADEQRDYDARIENMTRRILIPLAAFFLGSLFIAGVYFGILIWAQGKEAAMSIFLPNRGYVIPIWITFGVQSSLYSILRFRLFIPTSSHHTGTLVGTSGGTSVTAMVACCLHHVTDVLPVLGLSAAATFLTRYQRPFMLLGLGVNIVGIVVMLIILYRENRKLRSPQHLQTASETL